MATSKIYKQRKNPDDNNNNTEITEHDYNILLHEFSNMKSNRSDTPLQPNSVKSYCAKLQKLSILATKKPYQNYKFLLDTNKIIDIINKNILKSSKDYYSSIVKLLKSKPDINNDVIKLYSDEMKTHKKTEDTARGNNTVSEKHANKLNSLTISIIKNKIINYEVKNDMDMIYQLICAFYWLGDFTPRNELYNFKIRSNTNKKPMNDSFNYIIVDKNNNPIKIVMLNYKTKATYGKQEFNISGELKNYLFNYLTEFKKLNGDYLFVDKHNEPFTNNNFLTLITSSMKHVLGSEINVDLIRQFKLTNIMNDNPLMTINERRELARNYLHSEATALEYVRPALINAKT